MSNEFSLEKARKRLVARDNSLIQDGRFSLSLMEEKAILYMVSKIQPNDEPGKRYSFDCKEFQSLLNWSEEASYFNIKIMLQNLGDASIWVRRKIDGRDKDILVRWFNIVHLDPGNRDIEISFHEDIWPYLLDLKENRYTSYKFQDIALMQHKYTLKIFDLLKSYQNNRKWVFENGTGTEHDLQIKIADTGIDRKTRKAVPQIPEGWSNWSIFKRDVLDPAVKEINTYTALKVAYEGKKFDIHKRKTRAIRTIEFYIAPKTIPEQERTDAVIDAEYHEIENEERYHQMTVEEMFFENHKKSLEEERKEKEKRAEEKKEEKIIERKEKMKHPMLYEEVNEARGMSFDDMKLELLWKVAIQGRVAGIVPNGDWELFATDLITYYLDKIMATPEETRTTTYSRLMDAVKKDYDGETERLYERYAK